ncbi:MAG TPA: FKBP-type peptidyl-prolyl cis-trans isomerase [Candidatus Saccharimonadales bacterium]|nr:FKBP-type peptidyl-prolyl cis-trans isomerase [Candidatus Saccharimonadales bacterium]
MSTRRDRVFAWMGVVVAVASALALSGAVIIQQIISDHAARSTADASNASQTSTCTDNSQTEPTLAAPDSYKPAGAVTSLQRTDLTAGNGAAAKAGDCLVVKYYGTLASDGTMFDENFTKTTAFAFTLGAGQVIQGWDQGLVGLKVGGVRRLVIPAALGYGSQSPSAAIPANSDLVFVVKLLRIQS